MLSGLAGRYQRLIDYFVPHSIRSDRAASNQARMFLISHTMGPILGNSVPIALYIFDPTPSWDILVLSASITAFWIFPFLLKRNYDYNSLVIVSVANLNFCIFWSCYFNGGVLSPTLPWVLLIPILSFFYIGGNASLQRPLMAIFAGSFLLFLLSFYGTNPPANDTPELALVALGTVSTVAALCYVATMAIYYARIFDAGVELENEVRRRRLATDQLRAAIVAADEAGIHKAEFLARMSHELRTPLNAVIGYSQILRDDALEANDLRMREDVERIHEAGQYLLRLINIILDLSKIEAGRMQFTVKPHVLADVLNDVVSKSLPAFVAGRNTLELEVDAAAATVETDGSRLAQILGAVLDNIPMHAPGCRAELRCRLLTTRSPDDAIELTIRDSGPGIDQGRLATLFESLADKRDAAASKYGGTGLSLTIMSRQAAAMGCSLAACNATGGGALFTLVIPLQWRPRTEAKIAADERVREDEAA
ncbi:sensor histidine kinase [Phreatobacter sp.]|uniref:sensor histidine kinase n=1 Tax=Phreatobacter sp. TaxID=1966341 RepID=UPI003F726423